MSYYDRATYIALELSSQKKQEQLNGWQLEREFARQRLSIEQAQRDNKPKLKDRVRQICRKLLGSNSSKLRLNRKRI